MREYTLNPFKVNDHTFLWSKFANFYFSLPHPFSMDTMLVSDFFGRFPFLGENAFV